jgi:murein DD-endopeptidase MepM/ murein hydrolase activator NlpD
MRRRSKKEKTEILVRVATEKNLAFVAAILVGLLVFVGSPAGKPLAVRQTAGIGGSAIGPIAIAASVNGEGAAGLTVDVAPAVEDRGLYYTAYRVKPGDTVGTLADSFGTSIDGIVSFNNIQNTRALRIGQILKVPNMAGILYTAKEGDTADSVAAAFSVGVNGIIETNGLLSNGLPAGKIVFVPDARLPSYQLREINGDLFRWPIRGWITSRYGWRSDPFTGARSFHDGIDIGADLGTPIGAAMEGRVAETGYSSSFGNYILISHHSGWQSFYGHLNKIIVKAGQWINIGQCIGYVGNTGYSTGPHLHFTVIKNDRTMNPTVVLH